MPDWQDEQQSHRTFPHRSRKHAGNRKGNIESFQPRNMLGRYTLRSPFLKKLVESTPGADAEKEMWFEIHALVESETGYLASFDVGVVSGVMLIAGSRKALRDVVQEAEDVEEEEAVEDREENDGESELSHSDSDNHDASNDDDDDDDDDHTNDAFAADPGLDRPAHAFEKNTFKTPKWFAQWRGEIITGVTEQTHSLRDGIAGDDSGRWQNRESPRESVDNKGVKSTMYDDDRGDVNTDRAYQDNKAHFEFSSGACRDFKATFTCPALAAREVVMQGWKVTSKPSPVTRRWLDF